MYTRVSSDEQAKAGYSIPFQRARCLAFAAERQLDVVERFEEAHSAKSEGRPQFQRMLHYLAEHPEVRAVLVHKHDRLSRNLIDFGTIRDRLGCRVLAVDEPVEDSAAGRLHQNISLSMAAYHSDNLSQEVKKGLRGKFEAGGCVTRAPVGYRNVTRTRTEKARVVVDPDKAPLVVRMFERYATGKVSLAALATELADLGLRTKTGDPYPRERIRKLLRHPFYKGDAVYRGELRPGTHEAIVPEPLWNEVQEVLARRHTDTGEKGSRFFLLRGLLWCASCGRRFTAEAHPRGSYYRCMPDSRRLPCPEPLVPIRALEDAVEQLLPMVVIPPARRGDIVAALERIAAEQADARRREEQSLRAKAGHLQAKLLRLGSAYADGAMPREEYTTLRQGIDAELRAVTGRLDVLARDVEGEVAAARALLDRAAMLPELYAATAEPEDRKALLAEVFHRILIKDRTIARIEYNPPFELILDPRERPGSRGDVARNLLDRVAGNGVSS